MGKDGKSKTDSKKQMPKCSSKLSPAKNTSPKSSQDISSKQGASTSGIDVKTQQRPPKLHLAKSTEASGEMKTSDPVPKSAPPILTSENGHTLLKKNEAHPDKYTEKTSSSSMESRQSTDSISVRESLESNSPVPSIPSIDEDLEDPFPDPINQVTPPSTDSKTETDKSKSDSSDTTGGNNELPSSPDSGIPQSPVAEETGKVSSAAALAMKSRKFSLSKSGRIKAAKPRVVAEARFSLQTDF